MPSYLEIALRATTLAKAQHEQKTEIRQRTAFAPCGWPDCAGCYEVAPDVHIHPPRCGEDYKAWLEAWGAKGKIQ
jgi:hypothetical protein